MKFPQIQSASLNNVIWSPKGSKILESGKLERKQAFLFHTAPADGMLGAKDTCRQNVWVPNICGTGIWMINRGYHNIMSAPQNGYEITSISIPSEHNLLTLNKCLNAKRVGQDLLPINCCSEGVSEGDHLTLVYFFLPADPGDHRREAGGELDRLLRGPRVLWRPDHRQDTPQGTPQGHREVHHPHLRRTLWTVS